jgi:hypothetical protein
LRLSLEPHQGNAIHGLVRSIDGAGLRLVEAVNPRVEAVNTRVKAVNPRKDRRSTVT